MYFLYLSIDQWSDRNCCTSGASSFSEAMRMGTETYHHLKAVIKAKYGQDGKSAPWQGTFIDQWSQNMCEHQTESGKNSLGLVKILKSLKRRKKENIFWSGETKLICEVWYWWYWDMFFLLCGSTTWLGCRVKALALTVLCEMVVNLFMHKVASLENSHNICSSWTNETVKVRKMHFEILNSYYACQKGHLTWGVGELIFQPWLANVNVGWYFLTGAWPWHFCHSDLYKICFLTCRRVNNYLWYTCELWGFV